MLDFDVVKWIKVFRKHGLPMQVATEVFADPDVKIMVDEIYGTNEGRWLAYGLLFGSLMCVCFTVRKTG